MKNRGDRDKEVRVHTSQEEDAHIAAEEKWLEEFEAEERYKDKFRQEGAKLEREYFTNSASESLIPIMENVFHNFIKKISKGEQRIKHEVFSINGIDIQKLLTDLEVKDFFDKEYKASILNWFQGQPPLAPVPINVPASRFVSLIADLMDARPKLIRNSKKFVYQYIADYFLFDGRSSEVSTIRQIMKPSSRGRVSHYTGTIPNIQNFMIK